MYLVWYKSDPEYSDQYSKLEAKDWAEAQEIKKELLKYYDNIDYNIKLDIFITGSPIDFPLTDEDNKEQNSSYYFYAFMNDEIAEDDESYTGTYWIVHKDYWAKEHCLDDQGVDVDTPEGFFQCCESEFEYNGSLEEGIQKLIAAGFVWCNELAELN